MAEKVTETEEPSGGQLAETLLRVAPTGLCMSALALMVRNAKSTEYGDASYSNFTGFRHLVYANGIGAAYSYFLLSSPLALACVQCLFYRIWAIFLLDQVLTYVAAAAVSTEVVYLANEGDISVTWSQACEGFAGFCHRATASVVVTFAVVACFMTLSVTSSHRLFSSYDPPAFSSFVTGKAALKQHPSIEV